MFDEDQTEHDAGSRRAELERKSTEELFAATLEGDYDDDAAWDAVTVLRLRGTGDVFEVAKRYCESENAKARARGLSVLAQLGEGMPEVDRPFMPDSVSIAIGHLRDYDQETVRCAAWALSHLGTQEAVEALLALRNHPDHEVRHAIACCIEVRQHPKGAGVLLALMEDENEVVRDWATFAIGSDEVEQDGVWRLADSAEIRTALHRRLEDEYEDARREAIWGLARRKDTIGLKLLLNHLESEDPWQGDEDTAQELLGLERGCRVENLREGLRDLLTKISHGKE